MNHILCNFFFCYFMLIKAFWAGIVIGRFTQPLITKWISYRRWMEKTFVITALLFVLAFLCRGGGILIAVLFVSGAATGAAYPVILSMACELYPENTGAATSAISLISSVTGTVLAYLIGMLVAGTGYVAGMLTIPVMLVLCTLILVWYRKRYQVCA